MKNNERVLYSNVILLSFVGTIFAILFLGCFYYIYDYNYNYKTVETLERLDVQANTIKEYPISSNILCEEGVSVQRLTGLKKIIIYGCLNLNNNVCSGEGKICLIKTTERVRK